MGASEIDIARIRAALKAAVWVANGEWDFGVALPVVQGAAENLTETGNMTPEDLAKIQAGVRTAMTRMRVGVC